MSSGLHLPALWRTFARSGAARRSGMLIAAVASVLVLAYSVLIALSPTPEQVADRELGGYDGGVQVEADVREDPEPAVRVRDAARNAGATAEATLLESLDLRVTGGLYTALYYAETDWSDALFDRYTLESGHWPRQPAQVVVTERLARELDGEALEVLSGTERLQVVGVVRDAYGLDSRQVLAAEGTWNAFDWSSLSRTFPNVAASLTVFWAGTSADEVVSALAEAGLVASLPSLETREDLLTNPSPTLVDQYPFAFTIPAILAPAGLAAVVVLTAERRLRRSIGVLRVLGIASGPAVGAAVGAWATWVAIGAGGGSVVGAGLGLLARPLTAAVAPHVLAPPVVPWAGVATVVASTLLALALTVVGLALRRPARALAELGHRVPARTMSYLRLVAIALSVVAILWLGASLRTMFDIVWLTAACVACAALIAPSAVRVVVDHLPDRRPSIRLAKRQLAGDRTRVGIAVALLTATLAPSLVMATLVASVQSSGSALMRTNAGRDQLVIATNNAFVAPPSEALAIARESAPDAWEVEQFAVVSAEQYVTVNEPGLGYLVALGSAADAARMCGALDDGAAQVLDRGGVLLLNGGTGPLQTLWFNDGSKTAPVPAGPVACPDWGNALAGVMLTSGAHELGLETAPEATVFGPVTADQFALVRDRLEEAGLDVTLAQFGGERRTPSIPPPVWIALVVTSSLAIGAALLATRSQARILDLYRPTLSAVGLNRSWASRVLRTQVMVITVLGALLALVTTAVPLMIGALTFPGIVVVVPWPVISALVLAILATAWLASPVRTDARSNRGVDNGRRS